MTQPKEEPQSEWQPLWYMALALLVVVVAMLLWKWELDTWAHGLASADPPREDNFYAMAGTFGDAFAPVVGLISSLALGAAIASMMMQRKELALQREANRTQIEGLKASTAALVAQNEAMREQVIQQREANRLSGIASRLAGLSQLIEIDRRGVEHVSKRLSLIADGDKPDELKRKSIFVWHDLTTHEGAGASRPPWQRRVMSQNVAALLLERIVVSRVLKQLDVSLDTRPTELGVPTPDDSAD